VGKRSTGRRLAMQILYQLDIRNGSMDEAVEAAFSNMEYELPTRTFAQDIAAAAWAHRDVIDPLIEEKAKDWRLDRIFPLDKSILRLAFYELLYAEEKDDKAVVINEAVELAKTYSDPDAAKFINGILGA
jgi:N utilization substance protein B